MAAFLVSAAIVGVPAAVAYFSKKKSQGSASPSATAQDHIGELSGTVSSPGDSAMASSPAPSIPSFAPMFSYQPAAAHAVVLATDHPSAVHALRRSGMAVHSVKVSVVKPQKKTPPVAFGRIPSSEAFQKIVAMNFVHSVHAKVTPAPPKQASFLGASSLPNPVTTRVSASGVEREINARLKSLQ